MVAAWPGRAGSIPTTWSTVRGATSSVGQAAVNLAVDHGATVVATTRAADRVPLQEIVTQVERGAFEAEPKRVFAFDEIADAHRLMDAGRAGGKLVVTLA